MKITNKIYFALSMLVVSHISSAGIINFYNDQSTFINATGASSLSGPLVANNNPGADTLVLGDLSITTDNYAGSDDMRIVDWSTLNPGGEIGISGTESIDISYVPNDLLYSFGFFFVEPSATDARIDGTNTPVFYDSPYTISLFNNNTLVDSFSFTPDNDVLVFMGFTSNMGFDTVSIVETLSGTTYNSGGAAIDTSNDNEFFGEMFGTTTQANVSAPSALILIFASMLSLFIRSRLKA